MDLFLIVVIPSKKIWETVDKYRKRYAKYTKYKIVPHFTIYPPFYILGDKDKLIEELKAGMTGTKTGKVRFNNVGYFRGKNNVAFFEPDKKSSEYLKELAAKVTDILQGKVKNCFREYTLENFKPHMTIAERIPEKIFSKVKTELDRVEEEGEFEVETVWVYKHDKEKGWCKISKINLGTR